MKYIHMYIYMYIFVLFCFVLFCFVLFCFLCSNTGRLECAGVWWLSGVGRPGLRCRRCRGFLMPQVANWPWSGDEAQCLSCVAQNLTESIAGICVAAFLESVLLEIERTLME